MKFFIIFLAAFILESSEASKHSENEVAKAGDSYQATLKDEDGKGFCKASGFCMHALSCSVAQKDGQLP